MHTVLGVQTLGTVRILLYYVYPSLTLELLPWLRLFTIAFVI